MSLTTVEGIYKDGKVEIHERPEGVGDSARVLVTFLPGTQPEAEEREKLRQQAFARMERGITLGGPPHPTREEIYEERIRELDERRERQRDRRGRSLPESLRLIVRSRAPPLSWATVMKPKKGIRGLGPLFLDSVGKRFWRRSWHDGQDERLSGD